MALIKRAATTELSTPPERARSLPGLSGTKTPYVVVEDRIEAIHYCMDHAQPGDVIVLCGKGHETYQEIDHVKHHMDEREIVADYLKAGH